ncbi:hypothetical protein LWI29_003843 [Acer saccharum]|uniref:Uncharacterized protein n=1 Tax=Acer saccharum TaxID=4024 RepID=A0AA39SQY9_ACESA|nr:hypothetical protein LWI29_003843 [Acer saccharum]
MFEIFSSQVHKSKIRIVQKQGSYSAKASQDERRLSSGKEEIDARRGGDWCDFSGSDVRVVVVAIRVWNSDVISWRRQDRTNICSSFTCPSTGPGRWVKSFGWNAILDLSSGRQNFT